MEYAFMKVRDQMLSHEYAFKNISNAVCEGIIMPDKNSFTKLKDKFKRD